MYCFDEWESLVLLQEKTGWLNDPLLKIIPQLGLRLSPPPCFCLSDGDIDLLPGLLALGLLIPIVCEKSLPASMIGVILDLTSETAYASRFLASSSADFHLFVRMNLPNHLTSMYPIRMFLLMLLTSLSLMYSAALRAQAPPNDNLCNAIVLQVDSSCNGVPNGTNLNASAQPGEPIHDCGFGLPNTVWFRFTAPNSGLVSISTDFNLGTNDTTGIGLFTLPGGSCSQLQNLCKVSCASLNGQYGSTIPAAAVQPGAIYYVQVNLGPPPLAQGGSFCIQVSNAASATAPGNDDLCNATPLSVGASCGGAPNGDNSNATLQCDEPQGSCFFAGSKTVWYSVVAPPNGNLTISTDIPVGGSNDDTEIALYALPAGNCGNLSDLQSIACSQDDGSQLPFNSILSVGGLTAGDTYYVQVSGYANTTGTFCIEASTFTSPANDALCDAQSLVLGASCNGIPNGDNSNATLQAGEPQPSCFLPANATVWFSFVAPSSGDIVLSTDIPLSSSHDDTEMALYELPGGNCGDLSDLLLLDCDQNSGSVVNFGQNALIEYSGLTAGQTYYVQVSGWNGAQGSFCLQASEAVVAGNPANDTVCQALLLPVNGERYQFSNDLATADPQEQAILAPLPSGSGTDNGSWSSGDLDIQNSLWFRFVAPSSGGVSIDLCSPSGTNFNTQIAVYQVGDCQDYNTFALQGANDDSPFSCTPGSSNAASALELPCLTPGETYYLLVDGFSQAFGSFALQLSALPGDGPLLGADLISVDPACGSDGAILLGRQGGVAPLSYVWSNGASEPSLYDLTAGSYTLTLADGCDSSYTLTATLEDVRLQLDAGPDVVSCEADTFELGGSPTLAGQSPPQERLYVIVAGDMASDTLMNHRPLQIASNVAFLPPMNLRFAFADFTAHRDELYMMDVGTTQPSLYRLDLVEDTLGLIGSLNLSGDEEIAGMAYHPLDDSMYVLIQMPSLGRSRLQVLSLSDGSLSSELAIGVSNPAWLAIDTLGNAFLLDGENDSIFQIAPATGNLLARGVLPYPYVESSDADFDPRDNELYLTVASSDPSIASALLRYDLATGLSYPIGGYGAGLLRRGLAIRKPAAMSLPSVQWTAIGGPALPGDSLANPSLAISATTDARYVVSIDDGCGGMLSDTARVQVSLGLSAEAISSNPGEASASASGGLAPYAFAWDNGSTGALLTGLSEGTYTVTVRDAAGCTDTAQVSVMITGMDDLAGTGLSQLQVYPNPTRGQVVVSAKLERADRLLVRLFSAQGQMLRSEQSTDGSVAKLRLDLSDLPAGVYLLAIEGTQGTVYRRVIRR